MRRLLLPLIVLSVVAAAAQSPPSPIVQRWIKAVLAHRPGEVDQPLLDVAALPPESFAAIARDLKKALAGGSDASRNDVQRRGALLHTDLALLLPDDASAFSGFDAAMAFESTTAGKLQASRMSGTLVYSVDGEHLTSGAESGHWPFACGLLRGIRPDAASDEFVRLWFRAVTATFLNTQLFGNASLQLQRARLVLPADPVLLFYSGAMHEGLASPRVQNVQRESQAARPDFMNGRMITRQADAPIPSRRDELRAAERDLREALKHGAPPEAQIRLGRVVGLRGDHAGAARLLEEAAPAAGDSRLSYFRELFLGTEYGALGRVGEARACLDRAAALYPTAQTPLITMSDVLRRSGDRAGARDALQRLEALPADAYLRADPWWDYYRSYAADAEDQLRAVRAWVNRGAQR